MAASAALSNRTLEELQRFDSCTISNAIERFEVRTRNEGFVNSSVKCIFPEFTPKVGYAMTAKIRTSKTPVSGPCYYDRMDWWSYVDSIPGPRFLVIEDTDHMPGFGSLVGEIHACIGVALGCVAMLTNGSVRDLPGVKRAGLQLFAGGVSVSHAYAHITDFGNSVNIGGLEIKPGDLLHGDQHGVVMIPADVADDVPRVAADLLESEKELTDYCRSGNVPLAELAERMQKLSRRAGALKVR